MDKKKLDDMIQAIRLNSKMKGAYFFTPPMNASGRRNYENNNSLELEYDDVRVKMSTSCSCKNVYFNQEITVDGKSVNIAGLKKKLAKDAVAMFGSPGAAFDYLRANGLDAMAMLKTVRKTMPVEIRLEGRI